jgi:hypothetical protein
MKRITQTIIITVPVSRKYGVQDELKAVARTAGGCTISGNCRGYWVNPQTGELEEENVATVTAHTQPHNTGEVLIATTGLIRKLIKLGEQEVLVEVIHSGYPGVPMSREVVLYNAGDFQ